MATITVQVGASADDARNINGATSKQTTPATMHLGKFNTTDKYWNGFIFPSVTVPQGATITSATLDLYSAASGVGTTAKTLWYGILETNAAAFNTTTIYPEGKPRTTATVAKDLTVATWNASTGFGKELIDVTTLVQEIVNQGGWSSGNRMGLLGYDNGSANTTYVAHNTYDSNSARGAQLTITYATGPAAPTSLSGSQSGSQINLTWTDNAADETGFVLERKRGGSSNYYQIATPAANATSYSDTTVDPGYTYTYRIKARNGSGDSTYATSSSVAMTGTKKWTSHIQGWIFPGQADAQTELIDGRVLWAAKPEFGTISSLGVYSEPTGSANMIDDANIVARSKANSLHAYYTVSAAAAGVAAIVADSTKRTNCINGIVATLGTTGFEGVELDWEGYSTWSSGTYAAYKTFVDDLCTAVHAISKKVAICGPPIGDATEQGYYVNGWHYEDFESSAVDYICVLAYDWDFDFGAGTPIAPTARVQNVCLWMRSKITSLSRIVVGMPNYGYYGTTAGFTITNITEEQAKLRTGYPGTRDTGVSEEMIFASGGVSTVYNDQTSVNSKREIIEDEGITNISVWHLGDNPWFSSKIELDSFTHSQTVTGKARVTKTTSQTTTGKSRIQISTSRTVTGVSRVQKSVSQNITGKANITSSAVTTTKTVTGLARLTKTVLQTITGLARVTVATARTVTGLARITVSTARTITGKAAVLRTTSQTVTGKSRIQVSVSRTVTGLARVAITSSQTVTGKSRITVSTPRTITGKADIQKSTSQTTTGKARVQRTITQTITGLGRLVSAVNQTITGLGRVTASASRTILGKADILKTTTQTVTGTGRVTNTTQRTTTGKARLQKSVLQTVQGLSRITQIVARTITGKSRVTIQTQRTVTGKSRIQASTSRIITGVTRVTQIVPRNVAGTSRIQLVSSQTVTGKANIFNTFNTTQRSITGRAWIRVDDWEEPNAPGWQHPAGTGSWEYSNVTSPFIES